MPEIADVAAGSLLASEGDGFMALTPADFNQLSRLLDEGLAVEASQREAWLGALPAEHQVHAERLREMFAGLTTADRFDTLPKLTSEQTDETNAEAGERVGAYRLVREIGRGGMGSVWLAARADGNFTRDVALKLPRLAWGAGLSQRMAREREIGALLEHPNIARLYDAGVDDRGRPFLALELVDGQPIDQWCNAHALDVTARLRLFMQVARAVAYAHGRLVVHRDLKPSNVLVTADSQAHLLDFGIAKLLQESGADELGLTQQQGRVMTPNYASPEQVAGEVVTVASDIYSLGVLLYELLTATLPIAPRRSTLGAVEDAILEGHAPPASSRVKDRDTFNALRGDVDAILAKAMQRDPARRYATADALALDIDRHLRGDPVEARPDSLAYRLQKMLQRHWLGVSALASVTLALLVGGGVAWVQAQRAAQSAEREREVKAFVTDVFRFNSNAAGGAAAPLSTESLLEGGAKLIEQRFAGQRELQSELYGVVGNVFSDMGAYRLAVDYVTRQADTLAKVQASPTEQGRVQLTLAQALLNYEHPKEAESRVRLALLNVRGNATQELDALVLLTRVQVSQGKAADATATLAELDRRLATQGTEPLLARAWAEDARGRLLIAQNRLDEALPHFQSAVREAKAVQGPLSTAAIQVQLYIANQLASTTYSVEARRFFEQAQTAMQSLGGAHAVRAALESARFEWGRYSTSFEPGPPAAPLAALERSRAFLASAGAAIPDWFVPQVEFWLGDVKATSGDITGGLPLLKANAPLLQAELDSPRDRFYRSRAMGMALTSSGEHAEADRWLRERMAIRREIGSAKHPRAAADYVDIGFNLMMNGRYEEAQALLDQAPHFEPMRGEGADPERYNRAVAQMHAAVRLAQGDAIGALAMLARSGAPDARESHFDIAVHRALLGEALCAAGHAVQGLALLKLQWIEDAHDDDDPRAPWLARGRAVTGLCALAAGERRTALGTAAKARAAFVAQPSVSGYWKLPLVKLERGLGLHLPPL